MKLKKIASLGLAVTLTAISTLGLAGCGDSSETSNSSAVKNSDKDYGLTDNIQDGTILQCFCWSFNTIKESMEDIAMAGYSAIQTSPINAVYDGGNAGMELFGQGKWSYIYQPIEWSIGNYQLGTEQEFKEMCDVAESYGIKVIVDVVPNHTTTTLDAVSDEFIDAVGGMDKMYHSKGKIEIDNYGDRYQCTLQGVGGLPDVNTENPKFQDYFISFINKCIEDGADGFRYDTAKHIGLSDDPKDDESLENNFWDRVLTEVKDADRIFNYGEVLQGDNERITDYIEKIGATTASTYGTMIRLGITGQEFAAEDIKDFSIDGAEPNVVTWVESHDNYTGDDNSYNCSNEDVSLAWAVITARDKGTPLFFSRPYGSSKENKWGTMNRIGAAGDYIYKNNIVSAANHFRNAMTGESENIFNPTNNKAVVCIERGSKGITIVNIGEDSEELSFNTTLDDGTYTNRVDESTEYTVKDGMLTCTIDGKSAIILYNEGYKELGAVPVVKVEDGTQMNFDGDSIGVTLIAKNVKNASYSLNGAEEKSFNDGGKIVVGEGLESGDTVNLTLKGTSEDGNNTTMTYVFTKKSGTSDGTVVYFMKPDSWKTPVYAYVYDETSASEVVNNEPWPGAEMKDEGDGKYSYTFTEDWSAPLIIFTDGDNQSNGAMEPGAEIIPDNIYEIEERN